MSSYVPALEPEIQREIPEPAASKAARFLNWLVLLIVLGGGGFLGYRYGAPFLLSEGWMSELDQAAVVAAEKDKPMLVLFSADWCGACTRFKREVVASMAIDYRLHRDFVLAEVDLSNRDGPNGHTAAMHGVTVLPTTIVFDPGGNEVDRQVGGSPPMAFDRFLDGAVSAAQR